MISKEQVLKISKLARLELTEKEVSKMQKDLSEVLDYFNLLKKAKGRGESKSLEKKEALRKDVSFPQPKEVVEKLLEAVPDKKDKHIKVKQIL